MIDEDDGLASGGGDGPTAAKEVNLEIGVDTATAVQSQMEVQQAGVGTGLEDRTVFLLGFGARFIGGQAGGAAHGAILAGQFGGQQFLSAGVIGDFFIG
jgi:hypothetical protein